MRLTELVTVVLSSQTTFRSFIQRSTATVLGLLVFFAFNAAEAQLGNTVPRTIYYAAKQDFHSGQFRDAENGLRRALSSSIKIGNKRWIDSICPYSILGELYYRQGNLTASLKMHEEALNVFLANQDWLMRLQYSRLAQSNDRIVQRITWGTRTTGMAAFPDSMGSQEGSTLELISAFEFGGAVNAPHVRSVDAVEVARCLATSLRRRAILLGTTSSVSPKSSQLSGAVSRTNPPANHWVNSWVEVFYGLSQINEGQRKSGVGHLAAGAVTGGMDHPLTGIALLEIGRYHLRIEEYEKAMGHLLQASIAAARYRQPDVAEEAFRLLTDAYLANGSKGPYPPIATSIGYARQGDFGRLAMLSKLCTAEVAFYEGNNSLAARLLNENRSLMRRTDQLPTDIGTTLSYLDALIQFRAGNRDAATKSLQVALAFTQVSSLRQFQLNTVENLRTNGKRLIGKRDIEKLYSRLLREPRDRDWRTEPLQTLSWLLVDHTSAMSRWFELLIDQRELDNAVGVAEQLKRHRFYSSLPLGGRLLSLRWLFEGDVVMLGKRGMEVQRALQGKYPQMSTLTRSSIRTRAELEQIPLIPEDDDQRVLQRKLFAELASISTKQELATREIALRRDPAPLVFPPQPSLSAIQSAVRQDQAVLMFVATSQGWHAWFIRKDSNDYWSVRSPNAVRREISELLRNIGNYKRNAAISDKDLENEAWKNNAKELWKQLIGKFPSNGWEGLEELVIIPDGPLWYLPFELLRVPAGQSPENDEEASLISHTRIRYAPLASLSVGDRRGHNSDKATTLVGGQLFSNESSDYAKDMLTNLKETFPKIEVFAGNKKPLAPSGYTSSLMNRLIVWNDIEMNFNKPYAWSPAQYDGQSRQSLLSNWIEYPWDSPDQVVIPGFHTAAEGSLGRAANGQEIFRAVCGLMATGTRTALLSRWRTGGKVPAVLVSDFSSGLLEKSASDAWRHATETARGETLNVKSEPRVKSSAEEISADHPFFWSGYMLIDTGAEPEDAAADPDAPPEKPVPAVADNGEAAVEEVPAEENDAETEEEPPADPVPESAIDNN